MFNKAKSNLNEKISSLTEYKDIEAFCYSISELHWDGSLPVDLDVYLEARRIQKIINPKHLHLATIEVYGSEFILTSQQVLDQDNPHDRFILSHEIAHTFQYEIKSNTVVDRFFFINGSREQEYFSNYIARAILLPSAAINSTLKSWGSRIPSLKAINQVILDYNVEYSLCITRLLNDFPEISDTIIIRFIKFKRTEKWKIYESFASEDLRYNKDYFIPSRNYKTNLKFQDRFPTCGNELAEWLDNVVNEIPIKNEMPVVLDRKIFTDKPLTSFSKSINQIELYGLTTHIIDKYGSRIVNLLINIKHRLTCDIAHTST